MICHKYSTEEKEEEGEEEVKVLGQDLWKLLFHNLYVFYSYVLN